MSVSCIAVVLLYFFQIYSEMRIINRFNLPQRNHNNLYLFPFTIITSRIVMLDQYSDFFFWDKQYTDFETIILSIIGICYQAMF